MTQRCSSSDEYSAKSQTEGGGKVNRGPAAHFSPRAAKQVENPSGQMVCSNKHWFKAQQPN